MTTTTTDAPKAKFDEDVSELTVLDVEENSANEVRSLSNDEHEVEVHEVVTQEAEKAKEVQETSEREAQQGEVAAEAEYDEELIAEAAIELLMEKDSEEKRERN